jgi:hypothetical protein
MKKLLMLVSALLLTASLCSAQATQSKPTTLALTVGNEAIISVTSNPNLATGATTFSNYTASTQLTYSIRTSQSTGSGTITVTFTSDFSPAGGPSIVAPVNGDTLTYACMAGAPATACSATTVAALNNGYQVASFTADAHATAATATINWVLTNDPSFKTGGYSANVTYTISAT